MSDLEYLNIAAKKVDETLPDGHGFILLTFPFNNQGDGRCAYVSNAECDSAVLALKEILARWGLTKDWMKHAD